MASAPKDAPPPDKDPEAPDGLGDLPDIPAKDTFRSKRISVVSPSEINVLVVDDENVTRHTVAGYLKKSGYKTVDAAPNGLVAWQRLKADPRRFQLVLCDVNMPEMNGLELLERVRKDLELQDLPFLMMSATEQLDIAIRCTRQGADDFLLKPVRLPVVRNIWQNVWRKRREKQYVNVIEEEKFRRKNMEEEMESLNEQIDNLKAQVSEAIETPFQVITKTISELLKKDDLRGEVKESLLSILKQLSSSRLHQPAFSKLMTEQSDLNVTTRMWLTDQLQESATENRKAAEFAVAKNPAPDPDSDDPALDMGSWEFDIFCFTEEQLLGKIVRVFQEFGLLEKFKVSMEKFDTFLNNVKAAYPPKNPFHNFRHAFDVFQMVYLILTKGGAAAELTSLDIFALLVATLIHDIEHPGLNNQFQILARSPLAMHYNDRSILENFHCSRGFHHLMKEECDILTGLTDTEFRDFRSQVISNILATDLANHVQILTQFKSTIPSFSRDNKDHRRLLTDITLKVADISNGTRPFKIAKVWSDLVQEEFFTQGDLEKERDFPVSPFMDREKKAQPRMALNFGDYLVLPLFETYAELFPNMKVCCTQLLNNRKEWDNLENAENAEKEAQQE